MDQIIVLADVGVQDYNTMWACRWILTFWINVLKTFRTENGGCMFL
jgi:hypothetical protein